MTQTARTPPRGDTTHQARFAALSLPLACSRSQGMRSAESSVRSLRTVKTIEDLKEFHQS